MHMHMHMHMHMYLIMSSLVLLVCDLGLRDGGIDIVGLIHSITSSGCSESAHVSSPRCDVMQLLDGL